MHLAPSALVLHMQIGPQHLLASHVAVHPDMMQYQPSKQAKRVTLAVWYRERCQCHTCWCVKCLRSYFTWQLLQREGKSYCEGVQDELGDTLMRTVNIISSFFEMLDLDKNGNVELADLHRMQVNDSALCKWSHCFLQCIAAACSSLCLRSYDVPNKQNAKLHAQHLYAQFDELVCLL